MPRNSDFGKGGDGGKIFIFAKKEIDLEEGSRVNADGGDGSIGGKGGEINLITPGEISARGEVSAKGGKSLHETGGSLWKKVLVGVTIAVASGLILRYAFGI